MTDYILALLVIIVAIFIIKKVATCLIKSIVAIIALAILVYLFTKTGLISF
jgi:VIT1/CCC1 family predicted Fe2+/Mn2+ transporter